MAKYVFYIKWQNATFQKRKRSSEKAAHTIKKHFAIKNIYKYRSKVYSNSKKKLLGVYIYIYGWD